jgi:hypothetical protein
MAPLLARDGTLLLPLRKNNPSQWMHSMKFYNWQHKLYCGVDLHARKMYVCILNHNETVLLHQNIKTDPELFFELVFPLLEDIIVGIECVFCWYWLADFCAEHHIPFVLGHPRRQNKKR